MFEYHLSDEEIGLMYRDRDPADTDGNRSEDEAIEDSARGKGAELAFEAWCDRMGYSYIRYPQFEYDYHINTGDRRHRVELKMRDYLKLQRKGIKLKEADLAVRTRDGELYADRYVLILRTGPVEYRIAGVAHRELVRNSPCASWTEYKSKEVKRDWIHQVPSPP